MMSMTSCAKQRALLIERYTKSFILTFSHNFPGLDVPAGRRYSRSGRDMPSKWSIRYWQRNITRKCLFLRNKSKDVLGMFSCTTWPATGICSHSNETTAHCALRPQKVNVVPRLPGPVGGVGVGLWTCLLGSSHDWHAN
jgi:hypothetical protein